MVHHDVVSTSTDRFSLLCVSLGLDLSFSTSYITCMLHRAHYQYKFTIRSSPQSPSAKFLKSGLRMNRPRFLGCESLGSTYFVCRCLHVHYPSPFPEAIWCSCQGRHSVYPASCASLINDHNVRGEMYFVSRDVHMAQSRSGVCERTTWMAPRRVHILASLCLSVTEIIANSVMTRHRIIKGPVIASINADNCHYKQNREFHMRKTTKRHGKKTSFQKYSLFTPSTPWLLCHRVINHHSSLIVSPYLTHFHRDVVVFRGRSDTHARQSSILHTQYQRRTTPRSTVNCNQENNKRNKEKRQKSIGCSQTWYFLSVQTTRGNTKMTKCLLHDVVARTSRWDGHGKWSLSSTVDCCNIQKQSSPLDHAHLTFLHVHGYCFPVES